MIKKITGPVRIFVIFYISLILLWEFVFSSASLEDRVFFIVIALAAAIGGLIPIVINLAKRIERLENRNRTEIE
jgi:hypothetical protein